MDRKWTCYAQWEIRGEGAPAAPAQTATETPKPAAAAPAPAATSASSLPAGGTAAPAASPGGASPEPTAGASPPPAASEPPRWATGRIDELTAKWREEERKSASLQQQLDIANAALRTRQQAPTSSGTSAPAPTPAPTAVHVPAAGTQAFDDAVAAEADRRSRVAQFNRDADQLVTAGRGAYQDFDATIANYQRLGLGNDPSAQAKYISLVEAAIETGNGARVIYELGKNLDEAHRILNLPPVKMAVEVAKLGAPKAPAPVSAAPKPPTPIAAHAAAEPDIYNDRLTYPEWLAARERDLAQKKAAGAR